MRTVDEWLGGFSEARTVGSSDNIAGSLVTLRAALRELCILQCYTNVGSFLTFLDTGREFRSQVA